MTDSNADQGQDPQENDGICPYMFEPNKNDSNNEQLSYSDDDSTSTGEDSYSSDDSFEEINAWRRTDLSPFSTRRICSRDAKRKQESGNVIG